MIKIKVYKMLTRHTAREIVLQTLFNIDSRFNIENSSEYDQEEIYDDVARSLYKNNMEEKDEFLIELLNGVIKEVKKINEIINKSTPDWGVVKTAIIDRNILRIAIYEMLFSAADIPPRVSINEAIELAKTFGHNKSFKFISGVLGSIYEAVGLKDKEKKEKKTKKLIKKKKMGAMPFYINEGKPMILMVHNIFNKWTLPKGTIEDLKNNEEESLKKILKKKINASGEVLDFIGKNMYESNKSSVEIVQKEISYFLFKVDNFDKLKVDKKLKGLNDLKWFDWKSFNEMEKYDDMKKIISQGLKLIEKKNV